MTRVLIPLALDATAAARTRPGRIECLEGRTMGTSWSARLVPVANAPMEHVRAEVQSAFDQIVAEMSHWEADSLLGRFNAAAAGEWRDLPPGFFVVLSAALDVAAATDGAYDPTAGALVDLWGFGPAPERIDPPPPHEIERAMAGTGWNRLALDPKSRRARQPGGCRLDFSAIAKGYGVDRAAAALKRLGIRDFLVEAGGELRGEGMKPDGSPWWVALERSPDVAGVSETLIALHGLSVATSGDYRRYFECGGQRYSHSIDPRTGMPVSNGVVSVSVVHQSCLMADVWSTALTVLGPAAGMATAAHHGLAALIVSVVDGRVTEVLSPRLEAMLD